MFTGSIAFTILFLNASEMRVSNEEISTISIKIEFKMQMNADQKFSVFQFLKLYYNIIAAH